MTAAQQLAAYFANTSSSGFPADRMHEMRRLMLDYLGVALSGSRSDSGGIVAKVFGELGGEPQSSVIGTSLRLPAVHAAFANAVAEHSIELDDVDDLALFHHGPPVVSAALAVAEWRGATGLDLLGAMLAGCEMMNRLSLATNPALRDRGFHTTPTVGVFGATVAAARLMGLSAEQLSNALGIAGAQASGLMEMYGPSMQKRINPGPAARNGVTAAMLAEGGFTGADTIFEGERGFGAAFAGGIDLDILLHELGGEIPVTVEYKPYSAARPIHNAIDAALQLRERGVEPSLVSQIVVYRHPDWANYHLNPNPRTFHEAQVSLPYAFAVALVDGGALPDQFRDEQLARPELRALISRTSIETDPSLPKGVSCRVELMTSDGRAFVAQVDDAKGSVANPMSDDELLVKFLRLAEPVVGREQAEALALAVTGLPDSPSVQDIVTLSTLDEPRHAAA